MHWFELGFWRVLTTFSDFLKLTSLCTYNSYMQQLALAVGLAPCQWRHGIVVIAFASKNWRSRVRIPPGNKVLGILCIAMMLLKLIVHCHCVYFRKKSWLKKHWLLHLKNRFLFSSSEKQPKHSFASIASIHFEGPESLQDIIWACRGSYCQFISNRKLEETMDQQKMLLLSSIICRNQGSMLWSQFSATHLHQFFLLQKWRFFENYLMRWRFISA
jgi:hypothetical protein